MIKVAELRIDNLISCAGEYANITCISNEGISCQSNANIYVFEDFGDVEPIPLTPQILKQCGFTEKPICVMSDLARRWHEEQRKGSSTDISYRLGNYFIVPRLGYILNKVHLNNNLSEDSCGMNDTSLQYLHELQNLYFALTGEELEIKL